MNRSPLIRLTETALLAALLCVCAPFSLPIGPIPITLATFAVYLVGALLPPVYAAQAVGLYLLLGLCGVPVFSGFRSGAGVLLGPTGGYLLAYLPAALLAAWLLRRPKLWKYPVVLTAATAVIYVIGTAWYMFTTGTDLLPACAACVVPFLPGDALKIAAATAIAPTVRHFLSRTEKPVG